MRGIKKEYNLSYYNTLKAELQSYQLKPKNHHVYARELVLKKEMKKCARIIHKSQILLLFNPSTL